MSTIGNTEPSQDLANQEAPQESQPAAVDWEKRYKDLQSYADKTRVGLESENKRLREATTVFTPPKTAEDLARFRQENPDWMGVIETVAHDIASNSIASLQEDVNQSKQDKAAAEIVAAHPDATAILTSPEFDQWANDQGPAIQAWLKDSFDSSGVIRALNYYKAMSSHSPIAPQHNEPSAAEAVRTHGSVVTPQTQEQPRRFTREQIAKMHPDEYKANYEAIKAFAQAGGFN